MRRLLVLLAAGVGLVLSSLLPWATIPAEVRDTDVANEFPLGSEDRVGLTIVIGIGVQLAALAIWRSRKGSTTRMFAVSVLLLALAATLISWVIPLQTCVLGPPVGACGPAKGLGGWLAFGLSLLSLVVGAALLVRPVRRGRHAHTADQ